MSWDGLAGLGFGGYNCSQIVRQAFYDISGAAGRFNAGQFAGLAFVHFVRNCGHFSRKRFTDQAIKNPASAKQNASRAIRLFFTRPADEGIPKFQGADSKFSTPARAAT
jgi:hypothetical protein